MSQLKRILQKAKLIKGGHGHVSGELDFLKGVHQMGGPPGPIIMKGFHHINLVPASHAKPKAIKWPLHILTEVHLELWSQTGSMLRTTDKLLIDEKFMKIE